MSTHTSNPPTDDRSAALPESLGGRYRIGRELRRGGMASVYLARDEKHGRDVAIKIIKSDLSASLGHDRFLREIEIAARLRHPNIVPLYDSGEAGDSLFFVMPYEDGQSLRERLREHGALPIPEALSVLRDVARALAYAHEHGVVHRDIKPDNVMRSGDAAVVTDFGIAKAVSVALTNAGDATLTQAGTVIGTPAYMAPEQATGDAGVDHRLAKAPADRPQSARELLPVLDGVPSVGVSTERPTQEPARWRWRQPRTWTAIAALAALAATGGYFATKSGWVAPPVTLAVLPFANIAGDSTLDYVADGLTDEVASALGRVPGLLIKSRTGARRYRGQLTPDVTEAGARLKAEYLVTAVVRQELGQWVLSAEFARAADAASLWDSTFRVSPNEQAVVADAIAGSLATRLRGLFPRAIGVAPVRTRNQQASNPEAYRLYVLGQGKIARRTQSVREAADLFRQAMRQDSLFAPAYSGLSMALALSPWFQRTPAPQVHDEVVTAARRALILDPTLSLPHVAIGLAQWLAYDWGVAETEFKTAIRLDPSNVEAHLQYGRLLGNSGRYREALTEMQEARRLDPASVVVLSHMSFDYRLNGQLDSALVESRRALETDSTSPLAMASAIHTYLAKDRLQQARALAVRLPEMMWGRAYVLAKSGDTASARQSLRRLDARPAAWGDESDRALAYLGLGDTANALSALERATDAKELWPLSVEEYNPAMDPIRASARYRKLLERVGLAKYPVARAR